MLAGGRKVARRQAVWDATVDFLEAIEAGMELVGMWGEEDEEADYGAEEATGIIEQMLVEMERQDASTVD